MKRCNDIVRYTCFISLRRDEITNGGKRTGTSENRTERRVKRFVDVRSEMCFRKVVAASNKAEGITRGHSAGSRRGWVGWGKWVFLPRGADYLGMPRN